MRLARAGGFVRSQLASLRRGLGPACLAATVLLGGARFATAQQSVIVIVGAAGDAEYQETFSAWAGKWREAAELAGAEYAQVGGDEQSSAESQDRQQLFEQLKQAAIDAEDPLWLVLIGHGTFDGKTAKFNLRGPDVSAAELAEHLQSFRRPLAIINCASSSAPFINALSAPGRVIVTATKSGYQYNYARFGKYLSDAVGDSRADLDKDEQTSLLEAFLFAGAQVAEFYDNESRIATEDAVLDDNGDGLGTLASWFRGVRAVRTPKDSAQPDGLRANQFCLIRSPVEQQLTPAARAERDRLEAQLEAFRAEKDELPADAYYAQLEALFVELAQIYQDSERQDAAESP